MAYPGRRTCVNRCRGLETKRSDLLGYMTALQGVHVLKSLLGLMWGGVVWFATFDPLVLRSYPFYKFHPTQSHQFLPVLAPNDEE